MENKNKIYIYLLVIFFAVFVGTGLFVGTSNRNNQSKENAGNATSNKDVATLKQENLVMPTVAPTDGLIKLDNFEKNWASGGSYKIGENVNLTLAANSNGKKIVGYDVVLTFDPLALEFVGVRSILPDFQIKSYVRENKLILTAFQSTSSSTSPVFGGTNLTDISKIADLTFKAKKTGLINIDLVTSSGNERTDLVTDNTEVLNPQLTGATVGVK